ncbi:MAG: hypothetical protein KJ655_05430 [Candidatus Thermoplasmatota archaeon]|nr:hypothetical protein [Candidatus Thermoplasmatota archaeon]
MTEDVEKLEEELKKKKGEMGLLLKELRERAEGKEVEAAATEGIEEKMRMLKEMQTEILEKKTGLEKALKEVQEVAVAIKELKGKPEETIKEEIKPLQERASEKKEELEKVTREMESIKEKYEKKFSG